MGSIYKNRMRYTGEASSGDNVFVKYKTEENEVVLNTAIQNLIDGLESTKAVVYLEEMPETITDNFYVIDGKVYIGKEETQTLSRIYTAKEVDDNFIKLEEKGEADGVAPLDENKRIPVEYLPSGALSYVGNWDASTGTYPADGTRNGEFYIVTVAGTIEDVDYLKGDWIIWNGTEWDRVDNSDTVTSVDGRKGEIDLTDKYAQLAESNTFTGDKNTFESIDTTDIGGPGERITFNTGKVRINNKRPVLSINGEEVDDDGNIDVLPKTWQGTWSEYQAMDKDSTTMYLIINR